MHVPLAKGFSISLWMGIAHPFLMPLPSSKLSLTPLLIAVTFLQPLGQWEARGTFRLAPSSRTHLGQMRCLFQPSRHRLPYSEWWPLSSRFFSSKLSGSSSHLQCPG